MSPKLWSQGATCNEPEVVAYNPVYNEHICAGLAALAEERLEVAAIALERAVDTPLHEVPNYQPFGRLAIVYWQLDESEKARMVLAKAELGLGVVTGVYQCLDTPAGKAIFDRYGNQLESKAAAVMT